MGLIENIYFAYVYTDIFMHGYGYILGHSDHSAFTAHVPLAVFSWLFLSGKMYIFESNFGSSPGSSPCFVLCRQSIV